MDFSFATFATIFLLFTVACCAPRGRNVQDACAALRNSSLELNQVAKTVSQEVNSGSKAVTDFNTSLVWMEAKDMCDPATLRKTPAPCIGQILEVMTRYSSAVETVAGIESCKRFADVVKPKLDKLHSDIGTCVRVTAGYSHHKETHISQEDTLPAHDTEKSLLCKYIMDRLFSFSILTARVFSVGDPANHPEGPSQTCM